MVRVEEVSILARRQEVRGQQAWGRGQWQNPQAVYSQGLAGNEVTGDLLYTVKKVSDFPVPPGCC